MNQDVRASSKRFDLCADCRVAADGHDAVGGGDSVADGTHHRLVSNLGGFHHDSVQVENLGRLDRRFEVVQFWVGPRWVATVIVAHLHFLFPRHQQVLNEIGRHSRRRIDRERRLRRP